MAFLFDDVECLEEEKPRNSELLVLGLIYIIIMVLLVYGYEQIVPVINNKTYPFQNSFPNYTFVPWLIE